MQPASIVGIFCEDIREERSDQNTIIGALPDNLQMAPTSGLPEMGAVPLFPRLGLYLRAHFDPDDKPSELSVRIVNTDGKVLVNGGWDQAVLDKAFADAKNKQMPIVGLIFKAVAGPIPILANGRIVAIATVNGTERIAAILNVTLLDATASAPPASQSPDAAPASS